jgi:hypothetical protein
MFALPLLFMGAFLLAIYINKGSVQPTKAGKWKFILSLLLINYAVLYLLFVASHDIIT